MQLSYGPSAAMPKFGSTVPSFHKASCCNPPKMEAAKEEMLILFKPDAMQKGIVGQLLTVMENMHLKIAQAKVVKFDLPLLKEHYEEHINKSFFKPLAAFMQTSPVLAMVMQGNKGSLTRLREMLGESGSKAPSPGTIRARFAKDKTENCLHVSGNLEEAKHEIARIFPEHEKTKSVS